MPITRHFVGFFYNKEIFRESGIDIPQNWNDLIIAAETLKSKGISPFSLGSKNRWPAQFWFDYILLRTAGYDYREDLMNKASRYTDLEVLRTMDIWKNLLDKDYFNNDHKTATWDEAAEKLVEGNAAMTLMGTWTIPYMKDKGMSFENDYGFFPFPLIDESKENVALGPIDGILLSKGSDHMELSKEILFYLAQPETQKVFNVESGAIAPHNDVKDSAYSP